MTISFERFYAGAQLWTEVRAYPAADGLFVHLRDITERKRAAEAEMEARANAERVAQLEREVRFLQGLAAPPAAVTAVLFDSQPLPERTPDLFAELVRDYEGLMELALEGRAYGVRHSPSDALRAMSDRLGFLRAGPRDVVEVLSTALKGKVKGAPPAKAQAYVEEGRLMLLELMGHLASYYRIRLPPGGSRGPANPAASPKGDGP